MCTAPPHRKIDPDRQLQTTGNTISKCRRLSKTLFIRKFRTVDTHTHTHTHASTP
jgi:hypothetical protein